MFILKQSWHSILCYTDTQDQDELERIFSENRSTLDTYVRRIADAFQSNDIEEARRLIAEIKYFVNVEDKIKERTYLHWNNEQDIYL